MLFERRDEFEAEPFQMRDEGIVHRHMRIARSDDAVANERLVLVGRLRQRGLCLSGADAQEKRQHRKQSQSTRHGHHLPRRGRTPLDACVLGRRPSIVPGGSGFAKSNDNSGWAERAGDGRPSARLPLQYAARSSPFPFSGRATIARFRQTHKQITDNRETRHALSPSRSREVGLDCGAFRPLWFFVAVDPLVRSRRETPKAAEKRRTPKMRSPRKESCRRDRPCPSQTRWRSSRAPRAASAGSWPNSSPPPSVPSAS